MKLVVGLGNPGKKYEGTRHNVGFDVIDQIAARKGVVLSTEKFHAWFGQCEIAGEKVALLKPITFMNRSGQAVQAAGKFYKLEVSDLLVITDDHALPLGRLRMRAKGSAGGHNGLQDIISRLGGEVWARLRIGIGPVFGVPSVFVLSRFSTEEQELIDITRQHAADAVMHWVEHGTDLTMTRYNGDPPRVGDIG